MEIERGLGWLHAAWSGGTNVAFERYAI